MSIPSFGVGTFRLTGQTVIDSVRNALELGYRHIDTAQIYGNEAEVGQAIAESGVARDALFLTTKIWVDHYARDKLIPSLRQSLDRLRTDRVDLTLIHWPAPGNGVALAEFMTALAEAKALGLTRQIGVSNFNIALTREAIAAVGEGEIATNQIELSPYLQNRKLTAFLQEQGIAVTSYMTLGLRQGAQGPGTDADRGQAPGDRGAGRAGVGPAAGLRGDPFFDPAREPGQQPARARPAAGCGRHGADRHARAQWPRGRSRRLGAGLGLTRCRACLAPA